MPVILGLSPEAVGSIIGNRGVELTKHSQGTDLKILDRKLIPQVWSNLYPRWLLDLNQIESPRTLVSYLQKQKLTLATAESCTGGSIAGALTDVPGASTVFTGGVVVYTAQAKSTLLDIPEASLPPGCVSEELTKDLAEKLRAKLDVDIALAITGVLGPSSPHPSLELGRVFIALAGQQSWVHQFNFSGDRETIKTVAVLAAVNYVLCHIARWYLVPGVPHN